MWRDNNIKKLLSFQKFQSFALNCAARNSKIDLQQHRPQRHSKTYEALNLRLQNISQIWNIWNFLPSNLSEIFQPKKYSCYKQNFHVIFIKHHIIYRILMFMVLFILFQKFLIFHHLFSISQDFYYILILTAIMIIIKITFNSLQ